MKFYQIINDYTANRILVKNGLPVDTKFSRKNSRCFPVGFVDRNLIYLSKDIIEDLDDSMSPDDIYVNKKINDLEIIKHPSIEGALFGVRNTSDDKAFVVVPHGYTFVEPCDKPFDAPCPHNKKMIMPHEFCVNYSSSNINYLKSVCNICGTPVIRDKNEAAFLGSVKKLHLEHSEGECMRAVHVKDGTFKAFYEAAPPLLHDRICKLDKGQTIKLLLSSISSATMDITYTNEGKLAVSGKTYNGVKITSIKRSV